MCVCTFNSMLLYDFFFSPSVENLSHFGCIRKGWEFKCWYSDFFCDPLTGLQVTSSLQSLKNKTRKCNCPSVWGLDCARTQMEVRCLNFYLIHSKSVSVCFGFFCTVKENHTAALLLLLKVWMSCWCLDLFPKQNTVWVCVMCAHCPFVLPLCLNSQKPTNHLQPINLHSVWSKATI